MKCYDLSQSCLVWFRSVQDIYGENEWDKLQNPDPQKGSAATFVL